MLLHAEGASVLIAASILYNQLHASWSWFAILFFVPDISMLGYVFNKKLGSILYNLIHTYTAPLLFLLLLWFVGDFSLSSLALIWVAHIGFDRLMGYGLKYETSFKDTHLQRV